MRRRPASPHKRGTLSTFSKIRRPPPVWRTNPFQLCFGIARNRPKLLTVQVGQVRSGTVDIRDKQLADLDSLRRTRMNVAPGAATIQLERSSSRLLK